MSTVIVDDCVIEWYLCGKKAKYCFIFYLFIFVLFSMHFCDFKLTLMTSIVSGLEFKMIGLFKSYNLRGQEPGVVNVPFPGSWS